MSIFLNKKENIAFLNRFAFFVLIASCVFTLTGFWGQANWLLDLTSHFPLQYLAVQLIVFFVVILKVKPKAFLAFSLALLTLIFINTRQLYAYYWPSQQQVSSQNKAHLKILHMNVLIFNRSYETVADILKTTDADIVSLQEINEDWLAGLKAANGLKAFPYQLTHLESGNILASRLRFHNPQIVPIREGRLGALIGKSEGGILLADIQLSGKMISLINLHPPIPLTPRYEASYLRYLKQLNTLKKHFNKDIVLIGDLNTTPWSSYYKRYLKTLNLKDARAHQGFYPTWNAYLPVFAIPIDHVLVTNNFVTSQQRIGPFTGSDHLPVYVDLVFNEH